MTRELERVHRDGFGRPEVGVVGRRWRARPVASQARPGVEVGVAHVVFFVRRLVGVVRAVHCAPHALAQRAFCLSSVASSGHGRCGAVSRTRRRQVPHVGEQAEGAALLSALLEVQERWGFFFRGVRP